MELLTVPLNDFKGKTLTEKLKAEIHKLEHEFKYEKFGYQPRFMESALVMAHSTEKYPELKNLGCSPLQIDNKGKIIADLLLDNFGQYLSTLWAGSINGFSNITKTLIDETSGVRTYQFGGGQTNTYNNQSLGGGATTLQIGADPSAVLRGDVKIGVPFSVGPQATKFSPSGPGGWNSSLGLVQLSGSIVTSTLGGVIEECGLFGSSWPDISNVKFSIMLIHDNVSPFVTFLAGETINIDYTFTL